ncbi:hypothetical protein [Phaeobacter sp. C3_T13_0]|uniref:hypothetical protein n=1 Tax=Phaeobacter cretensis TaxID=3342641 RepID=UPI0039BD159C
MKSEVLQRFSLGKDPTGYTEDRIVEASGFIGILDGSAGPLGEGRNLITAILDSAVATIESLPDNTDLPDLVDLLSREVATRKRIAGSPDMRLDGGFVFCLFAREFSEIWRVGDCKFRNGPQVNDRMFGAEDISASARSMIIKARQAGGASDCEIMEADGYDDLISELLREQCNLLNRANHPLSIGAINGTSVPENLVERFPAEPGRLMITSDGYPEVFSELNDNEQALARLLKEDPLCISVNRQCKGMRPGRLSFDDRSCISIRLV